MSIKITWINEDPVDEIRIYRSNDRIDLGDLPEPLTTISGDNEEYVDVTARRGSVYYYVVAKVINDTGVGTNDGEVLFSPNSVHGYFPETGHGPVKLAKGTWDFGYFGPVAASEFISNQQLCSDLSATTGLGLVPSKLDSKWHKFFYKGKILFIPILPISATAIAWRDLYHAGMVFGDESSVGVYPKDLNYVPTYQGATVEIDGFVYKVRLIKASIAPIEQGITEDDLITPTGRYNSDITDSEYFQTIIRLLMQDAVKHNNVRVNNILNFEATGVSRFSQNLSSSPAVPAVEEVLDENGDVISEASDEIPGYLKGDVISGGILNNEQELTVIDTETRIANKFHPVLEFML